MPRDTLPQDVIDFIKAEGFTVYMIGRENSYAIIERGCQLAYIQYSPGEGVTLASVHKPHRDFGTGFHVQGGLTSENLSRAANLHRPHWASSTPPPPVKYSGMEEYRAACAFNADFHSI